MKSALDCFHNAVRCEAMARSLYDAAQRQMLTSTAKPGARWARPPGSASGRRLC